MDVTFFALSRLQRICIMFANISFYDFAETNEHRGREIKDDNSFDLLRFHNNFKNFDGNGQLFCKKSKLTAAFLTQIS